MECIGLRQAAKLLWVAIMVRKSVTGLRNTDIWNGPAIGFAANHASDHASRIGTKRKHHQIIEQTVIFADLIMIHLTGEST